MLIKINFQVSNIKGRVIELICLRRGESNSRGVTENSENHRSISLPGDCQTFNK